MPSQAGRAKGETVVVVVTATVVGAVEVGALEVGAVVEGEAVTDGPLSPAVVPAHAAISALTAATPNQTRLRIV